MLAFSSRKAKKGGGSIAQPLAYVDPTVLPPNAAAGPNLLEQSGLILRPRIGGGSVQQPLAYMDPTQTVPSAPAGSTMLVQQGLVVRPEIHRQTGGNQGGFLPSVMKGVVNSGVIVAPLAAMAAKRMWNGTRKSRRGGGKKEDWAHNREAAKEELTKYGKPSALNVNKYAALKRKSEEEADEWLTGYILKKRTTAKKGTKKGKTNNKTEKKPKKEVKKTKAEAHSNVKTASLWKDLVERAKKNLSLYGKPSGPNIMKLASLHKKGENTQAFVKNFKTRKQYASPSKSPRSAYKNNLKTARNYLRQFGKPSAPNLSKFVSLKRKGESTVAVENAVKARGKAVNVKPVSPRAVKATDKSPPPKAKPSNWKTTYEKAKANLQALRNKPKAAQIVTLAALRRRGENNSKFLETYRRE